MPRLWNSPLVKGWVAQMLDLPTPYRDEVTALLRQYLPGVEVWAYGSRVTGNARESSDLDLVVLPSSPRQMPGVPALRSALSDSSLPILVDVHEWLAVPETFRQEIARQHIVLQSGDGI